MEEKFCLQWNAFHSNISTSLVKLRNRESLHDVTLVSDDHQKISAHRLVLSISSEYFQDIFQETGQSSLFLCLEGVNGQELGNLLDYMYNGEIQIYQKDLDRFLTVAQRFKIKGLINDDSSCISPLF